jgi:glycosyltransferase involved in cell wall biosynthesis
VKRMRVAYVDHTAKLSGGEIALSRLLPALTERVEPLVVLAEDGPLVPRLRGLGIEVVVLPLGTSTRDVRKERLANPLVALTHVWAVLAYAVRLRRLLLEREIDVVHTNSLKAGLYGCLAARLAGVPSVWHLRDRLAPDYLPRLAVPVVRFVVGVLPSRLVCNSAATLATVPMRRWPTGSRDAVVVPSPIPDVLDDADVTALGDGAGRTSRPVRGGGEEAFALGMVGRFAPWKGQLETVRAFARAELPSTARLVLVGSAMFGEDEYERRVREEVSLLGLEQRVEFRGFVDDVFGVLSEFDLLVHASTVPEPFGQVLVEGMAAGVPVIATRGGGPSEIVSDGVDGILYPAGDIDRLATLLGQLFRDPEQRERLRTGGRRRARDFSPQAISPLVVSLYEALATQRMRGWGRG